MSVDGEDDDAADFGAFVQSAPSSGLGSTVQPSTPQRTAAAPAPAPAPAAIPSLASPVAGAGGATRPTTAAQQLPAASPGPAAAADFVPAFPAFEAFGSFAAPPAASPLSLPAVLPSSLTTTTTSTPDLFAAAAPPPIAAPLSQGAPSRLAAPTPSLAGGSTTTGAGAGNADASEEFFEFTDFVVSPIATAPPAASIVQQQEAPKSTPAPSLLDFDALLGLPASAPSPTSGADGLTPPEGALAAPAPAQPINPPEELQPQPQPLPTNATAASALAPARNEELEAALKSSDDIVQRQQAELASLRLELDGARAELDDLRKNQGSAAAALQEKLAQQTSDYHAKAQSLEGELARLRQERDEASAAHLAQMQQAKDDAASALTLLAQKFAAAQEHHFEQHRAAMEKMQALFLAHTQTADEAKSELWEELNKHQADLIARETQSLSALLAKNHKTQEEHQIQSAKALQGVALAIERAARRDDEARQRELLERRAQRADEARDERATRQRDHTEFVGRVQTTVESAVRGAQADAQRLADEARDEWQRQLADSLKEAMRIEIRETVARELKAQLAPAESEADDAERKAEQKLKKAEEVATMVRDTCAAAVADQIGRERERERRARELERANALAALGKQMEGLQLQLLALATTSSPAQQHE